MLTTHLYRQLNINRGSIHICSSFSADGRCSDSQCSSLHICRAWLAGNCSKDKTACFLPHTFRNLQNLSVLSSSGLQVADLPACDDNLRIEISGVFPQQCIDYSRGGCLNLNCNRLHMCKQLLLKGYCSLPGCSQWHFFSRREP